MSDLEARIERLEKRIDALENREHRQEFKTEELMAKLGFDLVELEAEQSLRSARGEHMSIMEIVAESLDIPYAELKASLRAR